MVKQDTGETEDIGTQAEELQDVDSDWIGRELVQTPGRHNAGEPTSTARSLGVGSWILGVARSIRSKCLFGDDGEVRLHEQSPYH